MPIERYRDVGDMPRPRRRFGEDLVKTIAAVWECAHIRFNLDIPRGVSKYRSIEAAQQARQQREMERMRRLKGSG